MEQEKKDWMVILDDGAIFECNIGKYKDLQNPLFSTPYIGFAYFWDEYGKDIAFKMMHKIYESMLDECRGHSDEGYFGISYAVKKFQDLAANKNE